MRRFLLIALLIIAAAIGLYWFNAQPGALDNPIPSSSDAEMSPEMASSTVRIAGKEIRVTIVDTPDERSRGLSGRKELAPDEGMLFVFETDGVYGFWMKDMLFPIDIVWLSGGWKVVDIHTHVMPSTYPAIFRPRGPIRYVIEMPAGSATESGLKIGDIARLER
ncbi:MAG: hypothetical protein UY63_C0005G0033 [Parcubacteria group bacterium GW2011_GWA2_51_10]|nr:MAG: hypothetical protein UY63_C0005G0033 [Parcubacteria group bacterium GW2011_GWA2_51_10]